MSTPERINTTSNIPYTLDGTPATAVKNDFGIEYVRRVRNSIKEKVAFAQDYAALFPHTENVMNIASDKNFFIDGNNVLAYSDSTSRVTPDATGFYEKPLFDQDGVLCHAKRCQKLNLCC